SLGRLHASTAGREADFDALTRRWGVPRIKDPQAKLGQLALTELPGLLTEVLGVETPAAVHERARAAGKLVDSVRYRAFSPSDACRANTVITGRGVGFLASGGGAGGTVLLAAAYLRGRFRGACSGLGWPAGMPGGLVGAGARRYAGCGRTWTP